MDEVESEFSEIPEFLEGVALIIGWDKIKYFLIIAGQLALK
jgi:hypothetical protein